MAEIHSVFGIRLPELYIGIVCTRRVNCFEANISFIRMVNDFEIDIFLTNTVADVMNNMELSLIIAIVLSVCSFAYSLVALTMVR